ncbi:hypothetical protein [Microbacterium sp. XT11]|uniref:hypothetical protein n=1 Tax=Microbacterium sp. XT11 TaxID=367477 RepID=UPI000742D9BD|nr:hypothetical protein [Microbacterium sp. XT11]ALX65730.1 hypothetical protein AB663_000407 [Microbacterium sp. XT11]
MRRHQPLPDELGTAFAVRTARLLGVSRRRLTGSDLTAPVHGARFTADYADAGDPATAATADPFERQRRARVRRAREYATVMHTGHFFSHQTAASIWGAPLPLEFTASGHPAEDQQLDLHVSSRVGLGIPRGAAVCGHRTLPSMTEVTEHDGLRVSSPAATWAALGALSVRDLVALGDYFCRRWRIGHGRPTPGRTPLATVDQLREMLDAGRRHGAARLREAIELIREDAWSPRESHVRCILVSAGLPEPQLNVDVFDDAGRFLACVDMAYPERKVAIEYLGMLHGEQWARDVERLAALRAAGWTVIEVTSPLLQTPDRLLRRVAAALRG